MAGGPSRLFEDLAARYADRPEGLLDDRHRLLDRRLREGHVRAEAVFLEDAGALPEDRQEELERLRRRLQAGASWRELLETPRVGNFGAFVLSRSKRNARPLRDVSVPREHAAILLRARAGESSILRDEAERRTFLYRVTDAWPGRPAPEAPVYPDRLNLLTRLDGKGRSHPVVSAAGWAERRGHILANLEKVMGPLPDPYGADALSATVEETIETDRHVRKRIEFRTEGQDEVPAFLFIPKGLSRPAAAVLCLHQTTKLGKAEPAGMGLKNLAYAAELAERGFVALAPDYPNFGDYKVDPYAMGYASATMKGIWNHRRAVDYLQSLPEVDPARIGAIGHSLGGHNAIFAAVFDTRIRAVVSSCGFNAFPKYYGGNLAGWSHKGYMPRIAERYGKDPARIPFDFTEIAGALAPRPFFINAPLRDANFEVSGVRDCVEAARPVYALLGAPDALVALHPDAGHDFPPDVRRAAYEFLEKALR
jgi:dienelactone hydrolase